MITSITFVSTVSAMLLSYLAFELARPQMKKAKFRAQASRRGRR